MFLAVQTKQTTLPRGWWTESRQFTLALVALGWKAADLVITKMRILFYHQDEHFSVAEQRPRGVLYSISISSIYITETKPKSNHNSEITKPS